MNSIHFTILLLLVALLCDEGISGVPSDIFNFRNYATNLSSARFPVGSDDCSNCLHTQSARFHVDYLLEDEDVNNGCRSPENDTCVYYCRPDYGIIIFKSYCVLTASSSNFIFFIQKKSIEDALNAKDSVGLYECLVDCAHLIGKDVINFVRMGLSSDEWIRKCSTGDLSLHVDACLVQVNASKNGFGELTDALHSSASSSGLVKTASPGTSAFNLSNDTRVSTQLTVGGGDLAILKTALNVSASTPTDSIHNIKLKHKNALEAVDELSDELDDFMVEHDVLVDEVANLEDQKRSVEFELSLLMQQSQNETD